MRIGFCRRRPDTRYGHVKLNDSASRRSPNAQAAVTALIAAIALTEHIVMEIEERTAPYVVTLPRNDVVICASDFPTKAYATSSAVRYQL